MSEKGIPNLGPLQRLETLRRVVSQASGVEVSARAVIQALKVNVTESIRVTPRMIGHLTRAQAQQDVINAAVRFTMRTRGPETCYEASYPMYVEWAKEANLHPVSLKTFKNRALLAYGAPAFLNVNTFMPRVHMAEVADL